ncbi:MAG: DNA-binding response regulator, partial [bacterium]
MPSPTEQRGKLRFAIVDSDSSFHRVLGTRLEAAGWEYRVVAAGMPTEELVAMKVSALLIDPETLGPRSWEFLELVAGALPDLGVIVCSTKSTVAQRVRGLRLGADDWIN